MERCATRENYSSLKFEMDNEGGSGSTGCFKIEIQMDTVKSTNVLPFRKYRDIIREGVDVFVKNIAKAASGMGCSEKGVVCFNFKQVVV